MTQGGASALQGGQDRQTGVLQDFIAFAGYDPCASVLAFVQSERSRFSIYWPDKLKISSLNVTYVFGICRLVIGCGRSAG